MQPKIIQGEEENFISYLPVPEPLFFLYPIPVLPYSKITPYPSSGHKATVAIA